MSSLTQAQFCGLLGKLNAHSRASLGADLAPRYSLERMAGAIKLAHRRLAADAQELVPKGILLPIDTNIYTQLIAICPGLLPKLPPDVAAAALAVSAVQALANASSPADMLNTMAGDPLGRLTRMRNTVQGVVRMMEDALKPPAALPTIPDGGDVVKGAADILKGQIKGLATRVALDAVSNVVNPLAAKRCADRLCAVGTRWAPPG